MHNWQLDPADAALSSAGRTLLRLAPGWRLLDDASGVGCFLAPPDAEPAAYVEHPLGRFEALERFTSLQRFSPFWTRPAVGMAESAVQPETVWLLARDARGGGTLLVPLLDERTRFSLRAGPAGLAVAAETGDPDLACTGGAALFVAHGSDPHALVHAAAGAVAARLGGRLRAQRELPDFVDLFGWCTWDAFYKEVSPDRVLAGLRSLTDAGVPPRWLILDDGWQQWRQAASGEERLVAFAPNARFGRDLDALVRSAKQDFGVQRVIVWHALLGYWGGLDAEAFPAWGVRRVARSFGPGLLAQEPRWNVWPWGAQLGVPSTEGFAAFYDELHRSLASQGVDGVKVDAQGLLEGVSAGQGGRVALGAASRRALEASALRHFGGRLINCMACTPECLYQSRDSVLLRTSDDFFPNRPESHGLHLFANAMAGMWFGEFMLPDWDMFQSGHPRGAFHAAARAISGGPVYVSDGIGRHDAALLRKLVLSDGRVLRADGPGLPCPDSLFADPTREATLLKIFNRNGDAAVVGLFNAGETATLAGHAGPGDVPGLGADCIAFAHRLGRAWRCRTDTAPRFELAPGEWELVSFAPIERGVAVIGLADKFNSTAAVASRCWRDSGLDLTLRDGGRFLAWCEQAPLALHCDGAPHPFRHQDGLLGADLPTGGPRMLSLSFG
ncbi:Sip1-related alpha-galactosidase [Roseateles saccharophilus]|uniref:Raffinose synthase n=1 Tax=Roseateles saccharophilus TaxID=304 RepID=A0A4R3VF19_ROSSA|nr:Sip1-related alpha-galactosidase [Roseateles saccharophilus]MDG0835377.1 hypothetical protein [Roseateles saccharophilus]TCV02239.1 raffinose synthase [Roseateles saccharophilus]